MGAHVTRVFVYGSLMRGFGNHRVIARGEYVGQATTEPRYRMYSLSAFPGVVSGGRQAIAGEVYLVDETTLAALDRLEGHPNFYRRTVIKLADGTEASTYLLARDDVRGRPVVRSGSWHQHQKEQHP
jgi:gamma-glutamylcyclotransferase (GGCT)/AIG2-like uncharacterized protein YtfP